MAKFPSVGEEFGAYRITRQLGRGGMGVVFAAEQRGLGRTLALKVLSPELAEQEDYRSRFAREATVLARLDSPHIISIHDHGEQDGCLYIATQYVAGGDLSDALRDYGPMPLPAATQASAQVAWALADSHDAGIVHRDLKPSNVLLRGVNPDVFVYLCDFGIAQDRSPGLTAPGSVAGTFAYLAPERLRGEPATPSADLYALGCVFWTLVTGATPYEGSDVEIGMSHLNAPVPRVLENSPVAAATNRLLARVLAKDPAQRHPDAGSLRYDLQALGQLALSTPHPPLVSERPPQTARTPSRPSVDSAPSGPRPAMPPPSQPSYPSQPSHPSHPSRGGAPLPPPPPPAAPRPHGPTPQPGPGGRRRRVGVLAAVASVVAVVVAGAGIALVATRGDDDTRAEGRDDPTSQTSGPSESTSEPPTSEPTEDPTSEEPTEEPTDEPTNSPTTKEPKPFYPPGPPARGLQLSLGKAAVNVPVGWDRIDQIEIPGGLGARNYADRDGYQTSVFLRRTKPYIQLDSIDLLEIAAKAAAESLADTDPDLTLERTQVLKPAWLDGDRAARVRAAYYNSKDDLYAAEDTWFVQHGAYLYRLTFQFSRNDSIATRESLIDPVVVSFRWK